MSSKAPPENQTADAVLMIRPARFAANPETAGSNRFQAAAPANRGVAARYPRVRRSRRGARRGGRSRACVRGRARRGLPDEVFPNNWVSLHEDGRRCSIRYRGNRRRERRQELIDALRDEHGYRIAHVVDLTSLGRAASTSGHRQPRARSVNRIAYACRSPRTHDLALLSSAACSATRRARSTRWTATVAQSITRTCCFRSARFAVLCSARCDAAERRQLSASGESRAIDLSFDQLHSFAGNLLELRARAARDCAVQDGARVPARPATARAGGARRARRRGRRHDREARRGQRALHARGGRATERVSGYGSTSACRKLPPQICP